MAESCDHVGKGRGIRWTGGTYCLGCGLPVPDDVDRSAPSERTAPVWLTEYETHVAWLALDDANYGYEPSAARAAARQKLSVAHDALKRSRAQGEAAQPEQGDDGLTAEEAKALKMASIFGGPDVPHETLESAKRKLDRIVRAAEREEGNRA